MQKLTLLGRPISKKNSARIVYNQRRKHPMVLPSKAYTDYLRSCQQQLQGYKEKPFSGEVHVRCEYWLPDRRSKPDLINLLQATSDILEDCQVIENDRLVVSYDGSRIMGYDKKNPRADVWICDSDHCFVEVG